MAKFKEWNFYKLERFETSDGLMLPEDYKDLQCDIIDKKRTPIPGGGGLIEISVNNSLLNRSPNDTRSKKYGGSRHRWQVIYAIYERLNLVVLTNKSKYNFKRKKFSVQESIMLANAKLELDKLVEKYFKDN